MATTQTSISNRKELPAELQRALKISVGGTRLKRVKFKTLGAPRTVTLSIDYENICYHSRKAWKCVPEKLKSVEIGQLLEVRNGWQTDNFNKAARKGDFSVRVPESHCFSVIFRHPVFFHKSVDLVADTTDMQQAWVMALRHLIMMKKKERMHFNEEQWLIQQFKNADKDSNGYLTFSELWNLLNTLNLEISERYGRKIFEHADITRTKSKFGEAALDREEFLKFFHRLTERQELEHIMSVYSSGSEDFLLVEDLLEFLSKEQGFRDLTTEKCEEIIKTFEPDEENKKALLLGPNGFRRMLLSQWGSLLKGEHEAFHQDMTRPMCQYYIKSSHNTYLVGNQLSGEASVEGYINALKRGARLVELDVWDGAEGKPVIYHGHTLVKPIKLRSACVAINEYAFAASPYPVILSIENHCSIEQQKKMATIFKDVFKDKLYVREKIPLEPTPEGLKGKIIVKGKMLPADVVDSLAVDQVSEEDEAISSANESEEDNNNQEQLDEVDSRRRPSKKKKRETMALAKEFSDIVGFPSVKFKTIEHGLKKHPVDSLTSLSENRLLDFIEDDVDGLRKYTQKHLLKSYPKGIRTTSSNMDPVPQWNVGVQVVTLNMQTHGTEMDLNEAKFRVNGGVGYVLKPEALLRNNPINTDRIKNAKLLLKLKVISGQYLPRPETASRGDILDPYVVLETYGLPCDCNKQKTQVIDNNGFNPVWNEEFEFKFKMPDFALLKVTVKDYDFTSANDFVGQYSIPVNSIRPGYSHIHLQTGYAHTVDPSATLFVHAKIMECGHNIKCLK